MSKRMTIRMDRENYEFLSEISKQERSDLSKAVRDLVTRGRRAIQKGGSLFGQSCGACRAPGRPDDDHPDGIRRREPN